MSIFNDKALKGVADAVSKIMDEELKGNQHKIDANKNGKVDAHDFKLLRAKKGMKEETEKMAKKDHDQDGKVESGKSEYLGSRIRAAKMAGKMKEETELDEAFPTVDDAKKRMAAGKTATGSVTKTKTGLVHKRDYKDDDNDAEDMQKKPKAYGARQNFKRSTRVNEQLSFTEMLHLYNESGVEVINKIFPQTVKFGDTEVELIDANIVNGAVGITVAEEVDNETFTKEVEAQKEKNAGRGKKAEVAKASVQAVKQEEVEQMDEADIYSIKNKKTGQIYHHSKYPITKNTQKFKQIKSAGGDHVHAEIHVNGKPMKEEVEQIDEISKSTLGSYIKKASHDVAAKGAFTRHFADKSRAETAEQKHDIARKTMKKADKMQDAGMKRRANMAKAVDRLTKEEVQMDERTLTSAETKEKEKNVKGMKKSLSGFKDRYGDRAKEVMYATATKMAKKD
jgi:hypothetical protein